MDEGLSRRAVLAAGALLAASYGSSAAGAGSALDEARDAKLRELLARNREKHPIYRGGLANHLSMELCALAGLGATPERMVEFSTVYGRMLDPFPTDGPAVTKESWRGQLGQSEALRGFAAFYSADLRERGRQAVLHDVLPVLAPSLSSELFHCLIRTAYGVRFDDDEEIAHGLAYWSIKAYGLAELPPAKGKEPDFAALLARVRATPALAGAKLTGSSNPARMQQATRLEGFADIIGALEVDAGTLDRMARAVLAVYASTRDFVALHAVTSTHALRVLLPYFPERELALRHHAQGLLAAYVRMGAPAVDAKLAEDAPAWDAIGVKAIASADDHDAKFVYSCREEQGARSGELYRRAAALRVGLA